MPGTKGHTEEVWYAGGGEESGHGPLTILVWLVLMAMGICTGVTFIVGGPDAYPRAILLQSLALLWVFSWWIEADAAQRGLALPFDHGFLVFVIGAFFVSGYLLWSRKLGGCVILLAAAALYVGAVFVSAFMVALVGVLLGLIPLA